MDQKKPDFSKLFEHNKSGYILRKNIETATGGLLKCRYMANLDSIGKGIRGRMKILGRIAYPVESVIEYLEKNSTIC